MKFYTKLNPTIISNQGIYPDCMLHSLSNAGICTYKYAKYLNKEYYNYHKKYCRCTGTKIDKEYYDSGFYVIVSFIDFALMQLNISYKVISPNYISQLSKNNCGILTVYQNNKMDNHAVYKHRNYILDSNYLNKIQLKNYKFKKCVNFYKFI
jgi:hypothetical protein